MVILILFDRLLLEQYDQRTFELALRRMVLNEFGPNVLVIDVFYTQYHQCFINGSTRTKQARQLSKLCKQFVQAVDEAMHSSSEFLDENDLL